jgi:hypothetical protein
MKEFKAVFSGEWLVPSFCNSLATRHKTLATAFKTAPTDFEAVTATRRGRRKATRADFRATFHKPLVTVVITASIPECYPEIRGCTNFECENSMKERMGWIGAVNSGW